MHPLISITAIALSLGAVEGLAYWWMRPTPGGQGEPVLVYRPGGRGQGTGGGDQATGIGDQESETRNDKQPVTPSFSSDQQSTIYNHQSSIAPSFTLTPLPEIYAKSAPMLRCSSGQVLHARLDDSSGIHLAFFEWDGTDTGSVLEAFRHMPEACMGSIGMKLVEKAPSRTFVVRDQEKNQQSAINNHQSSISSSSSNPTLVFDHTVFRESGGPAGLGPPIHAFRAVWVSGVSAANARNGLGGDEFDRLRTIRIKSAIDRFRPAHARVIQGAVRGIADPDLAWQAFESAMLGDLGFQ